ncbi:uncharacterized protein [Lolium perenne]|uniref:uncharacterized protein n=1 Tax=Lolium perenne TaxID=4522 RepID=UPI0021EB15E6|nr:uncharacterized protein LOC127327803 [Lolium perenne]
MQILRLLAARRAASIATASPASESRGDDDEGPFFDLDFSSCSVRDSSSSSSGGSLSLSDSDDDDDRTDLDFIISLQRSRSDSPLKFCASEPPARANSFQHSHQQHCSRKRGISTLRSLSFGPRKSAPLYGGRHSFARSSSGRHSFARSSTSSARSLRLFLDTPVHATDEDETAAQPTVRRAPSRDVIRRYLSSISRRLRPAASPRAESRELRRLRKCRSASSVPPSTAASRWDDSAAEKQDGIAGAIAHCKDSLHRASTGEM